MRPAVHRRTELRRTSYLSTFGFRKEGVCSGYQLLAEEEHDGWMEQRRRNGWVAGEPRDDQAKIHPQMKPYAEISEEEKDKDRNGVRKYPEILDLAGYKIVTGLPNRSRDES